MKRNSESPDDLSRRSFLKSSAIGVGATAVVAATPVLATGSAVKNEEKHHPGAEPLTPVPPPVKWDVESDLVIVGAGGAGMSAAVSATENGAKVILLEKNPWCGGDSSLTSGAEGNLGSRMQKRIGAPELTIDQRVQYWLSIPGPTAFPSPQMLRLIVEEQGPTFDWLEDMGVRVCEDVLFDFLPEKLGIGHTPIDPEHPEEGWQRWHPFNGRGFTQALERRARALGIPILLESPVCALVAKGGKVVGVVSNTPEGKKYIGAKAVILTTGGFSANKDMLLKYVPARKIEDVRTMSYPGATGDGIRMAQGLGATVDIMDEIERWDGGALWHPDSVGEAHAWYYETPNQLVRQKSLTVNLLGKRFFDESALFGYHYAYQGAASQAQKDHTSFTLFDENCIRKEDIIKKFKPFACEYPTRWWNEMFPKYLADGTIMRADSIPEIAKKMGVDPDELTKTVIRYNDLCDKKHDDDFFKASEYMQPIRKPSFYAVKQRGGTMFNTWGGLIVDEKFRVLNKDWSPIPGLYVAGENAAGGARMAFCLPAGRLAGRNAAKEVLGENV